MQYTMTLSKVIPRATATLRSPHNQGADLSKWCGPVFNQLQQGSCTACTTRDYLLWLQIHYGYNPVVDPAVDALYYFGRKIFGDLNTDGGSTVYDAFQAAVQDGVIPASDESYSDASLYMKPPEQDVTFKATDAQAYAPSTENIRSLLESLKPVGIAVKVTDSLFNPTFYTDGRYIVDVGAIVPNEGHAVFCVAYEPDTYHQFLYKCQGSWGTSYGKDGYIWFTEAAMQQCLMEAATLDIPKTFTPPVTLSVAFTQKSVPVGEPNVISIHTSKPNQEFTVTSVGPMPKPESWTGTTDAQGNFSRDMMFTLEGLYHITVECDGKSETVEVNWS